MTNKQIISQYKNYIHTERKIILKAKEIIERSEDTIETYKKYIDKLREEIK